VVPLVDLSRRAAPHLERYAERVTEVLRRGTLLLGPETEALEAELASWADAAAPLHVVAVSSGAAALQLALAAVGVSAGDEVIVPAFTAVPTASAVAALGAVPVPVDVAPGTAALDPALVAGARTSRTSAVVVVHLYGRPAPLPDTDLPVVEDAAQAHGALRSHRGSAAVTYSFYPTKNLGGVGDGGAVVTGDADLAGRVRRMRVHGMGEQYVHHDVSQNFRLSELEAAWLRLLLPGLAPSNRRRREITARYRAATPPGVWQDDHPDHVHHLAVLRSERRDELRRLLAGAGVATGVHYPLALTQQPAYRDRRRAACPESEAWAGSCVSVPCFPELTDREVEHVTAALARAGLDGDAIAPAELRR